ncbi:MAG: hypothetical protein V4564_11355 [Pseudomonadota bacterium]
MAILQKAVAAFACLAMTSPAMANPIAYPALGAPVNVTGRVSFSVLGLVNVACDITMRGEVTSVGTSTVPGVVTFYSGTATDLPGKSDCNSATGTVSYPIIARTTSKFAVTIDRLELNTPIGTCAKNNVVVSWNNSLSNGAFSTTAGICTSVIGTLQTVSNPIIIG